MTQTTNYGLIGAGMMGQEHIRNIALLDNTNIAAIFEPDAAMRAAAADRSGAGDGLWRADREPSGRGL